MLWADADTIPVLTLASSDPALELSLSRFGDVAVEALVGRVTASLGFDVYDMEICVAMSDSELNFSVRSNASSWAKVGLS